MRKVLSFVLVLALVLGSFSMAFAADTTTAANSLSDIAGTPNEQAILVNYNLGIITGEANGTFLPEKDVTRAEFAAMITRALNIPESALAGYTASGFKDTAGAGWAVKYLAFCESKGIMLGDGAGNVMPGRSINTNEAVTMALRAVGYTANSSKLVGVWPSNYVSLAQSEGLYKNVVTSADSVDKANAAQIIYNLLTVELVQVSSDGTTTTIKNTDNATVSLLEANHDSTKGKEVVGYEDSALIRSIDYIGQYADVYRDSDDNIIAIGDIHSTAVTGTLEQEKGSKAVYILTDSDDVEYTLKVENRANTGAKTENADDEYAEFRNTDSPNNDFLANCIKDKLDVTVNVNLTNKSAKVWYSTVLWKVDDHSRITADEIADIEDGKLLSYDFDTDKNDAIVENTYTIVGAKSLSDIKADNIVYVYADKDKEIKKVAVGTEIVEGEVTKVTADDAKATIDGKVYEYANAGTTDRMEAGDSVKAYLDADGYIYEFDKTSGSADDYAMVINVGGSNDSYDNFTAELRLILADGSIKSYEVDSDIVNKTKKAWEVIDYLDDEKTTQAAVSGDVVKYSLDKNGVVDDLILVEDTDMGKVEYKDSGFYGKYEVNADAVAFVVDDVKDFTAKDSDGWDDKDNYSTTTLANLKGKEFASWYATDKYGKIDVLVVDGSDTGGDDIYGVITDKGVITRDGDKVYQIEALVNGDDVVYDATKEVYEKVNLSAGNVMAVLYKFDFNASNEINDISTKWTAKNAIGVSDKDGHIGSKGDALTSKADIDIRGNVVTIEKSNAGHLEGKTTVTSNATVYIYNSTDKVFEAERLSDLKSTINGLKKEESRTVFFFVTEDNDGKAAPPDIIVIF